MKGIIFDIKKFALHDGPGIRTTVFLKGCKLDCWWCHNPESIKKLPKEIELGSLLGLDKRWGPAGRECSVEELFSEIKKDQLFYDESGGGVTFSGGDPLVQYEFLTELLIKCKDAGIHTAVDTSGCADRKLFDMIYEYTDIFLYDVKILDEAMHKKFTGIGNYGILENLRYLTKKGDKVIVRIPLIPGITDTEENLSGISEYLRSLDNIRKIDLLPYNEIAESKYKRFNMTSRAGNLKTQDEDKLHEILNYFRDPRFEVSLRG